MAWCANQVKRYFIASFHGKASSHGKGCSCVVLPPSAIVFLFRLRGEWDFFHSIFFPNEIVDCVFLGSSSGTTVLSLTHVQGKSHPCVESRWAQRRWSCLASEKIRPSGCHGMLPPSLVTPLTLCEKRGEGWAQSGKLSPSPLNGCTSGSLSS